MLSVPDSFIALLTFFRETQDTEPLGFPLVPYLTYRLLRSVWVSRIWSTISYCRAQCLLHRMPSFTVVTVFLLSLLFSGFQTLYLVDFFFSFNFRHFVDPQLLPAFRYLPVPAFPQLFIALSISCAKLYALA